MNKVKQRALIELISDLVSDHEPSSWREKKEGLLALASEEEIVAINEFVAWFEADGHAQL